MNPSLDAVTLVQLLVAVTNITIAVVMYLSVREIRRDRRRVFLEKRLEEFYVPLINIFGHENLIRDITLHDKVEEIIVSRRHLCGRRVAEVLPPHFTAIRGSMSFRFRFVDEDQKRLWERVADAIWEEYIEILKEYYKLVGVELYTLPEKPKWMFEAAPARVY